MMDIFESLGRADALKLRDEAGGLTGTQIIAREIAVPAWQADRDYSAWPVGAPVTDEGQVWLLIQPHDAAGYEGRPGTLRALWGLAHTTDPARAKPWVDPYGTSGMYMAGECYRAEDGAVYQAMEDNLTRDAQALPGSWEAVL